MNLDLARAQRSLDETRHAIDALDQGSLSQLADFITKVQGSHGVLWTMGNGGSSSTGAHMACDVGKGIGASLDTPVRALSLNEQSITQSAWANDFGFEDALRNQLEQLARPGDAVLAISGSGNSANIVNAAKWAAQNQLPVAALVGRNGGKISEFADIEIRVDSTDMQVLENVHLVIVHWLFKALTHEGPQGPTDPHPSSAS